MPIDPHDLAARLVALCHDMRGMPIDQVDAACNIASDILSEDGLGDTFTDAHDHSLLDGIHWGARAALTCECQGGTIIRIRSKGGSAVSHQYLTPIADHQLAAIARILENVTTQTQEAAL